MSEASRRALEYVGAAGLVAGAIAVSWGIDSGRVKFSGEDEGGEYTWVHDDEGYGVYALPMTDRTLIFSPTPFDESERVYIDDLAQRILAESRNQQAQETQAQALAADQLPYEPNSTLDILEAGKVAEILRNEIGLDCPVDGATSLYRQENGGPDIQQRICLDFSTTEVIDGVVSIALAPEPKPNIPNPEDVILTFDERSDYCVWLADMYFDFGNDRIAAAAAQLGYVAAVTDPQYELAIRMNAYIPDKCDSVAGDALGIDQLEPRILTPL